MSEPGEAWLPEFKPGWPDVFPCGLMVLRSMVRGVTDDVDDLTEDELLEPDRVRLVIHSARAQHPETHYALTGDLTVENRVSFAGVTVVMPLRLRDAPDNVSDKEADALLAVYGEWASSLLYDHAAATMRTMLASSVHTLNVPFSTPVPELHTHSVTQDATEDE